MTGPNGGPRSGAGRPTLPPAERTVTVSIAMPRWLRDRLREDAGAGSVSALVTAELARDRQPPVET